MNNAEIADALDLIGDLLELKGENPFRVRAYRNGARVVRDLPESVEAILDDPQRSLTELSGIGKDLAEKIADLAQVGSTPMLEDLRKQVPAGLLAMTRIPGLGAKKAMALHKELGISTLEALKIACEKQEVRKLKGFAAKTEASILAGMELAATANDRLYWAEADKFAEALAEYLRGSPRVQRLELAGSYRRGKETVGDLDVLVVADDAAGVMDHFAKYPALATVIGRGDTKMSVRLASGLQADLRVVPEESFGAAWQYFTGSKDHNVVLRGMAKDRGLKINEYGVYRLVEGGGEEYVAGRTEEELYSLLGLPVFPPELREARREFELAAAGPLPRLIELGDLQGDLHAHTNATDGKATLEEMAEAAQSRGLTYLAITDHSKRVTMAHGLDPERLRAEWAEIDRLNPRLKNFRLLKGIELDILESGELDLPDDVLAEADWVVASVHYGQNQPRQQITRRIIGAIKHPSVSAIAHPTGRIINRRKPYDVDLAAVFQSASDYGKLLELNSNPARLDLDDMACAAAKSRGIPIVISTDAHSTGGLAVSRYGILQARRAGLTAQDVANTRPWEEMRRMIGKK